MTIVGRRHRAQQKMSHFFYYHTEYTYSKYSTPRGVGVLIKQSVTPSDASCFLSWLWGMYPMMYDMMYDK